MTKRPQINAAVSEVVKELWPRVRYIRYDIARDWTDEWAIFFRVMLSDEASIGDNLSDITKQVIWRLSDRLIVPEVGLHLYWDFRSESEQAALNEPEWVAAS